MKVGDVLKVHDLGEIPSTHLRVTWCTLKLIDVTVVNTLLDEFAL